MGPLWRWKEVSMFECVVCGWCTKDALVYSIASPPGRVVALCGQHCRRKFLEDSAKYLPADAEIGGDGD